MQSIKTYGEISIIERLAIKVKHLFKRGWKPYGWSSTKVWKRLNNHLFH